MEKKFYSIFTWILVFIALMFSSGLAAQNEDCIDFEVICSNAQFSNTSSGSGIDDFLDPDNNAGCLSTDEHESAWYYFEFNASTPPNSVVTFVIDPNNFTDDYDFALYGPNVTCDNLGSPIRCSYSADDGPTGLATWANDNSEGAGGDAYVSEILVNAGDGFYLLVDNYSSTTTGFDMTWGGDGSNYLDCNPSCTLMVELPPPMDVCKEAVFTINSIITDASGSEIYAWVGTGGGTAYLDATDIANPQVTLPPGFSGSITYTLTVTDGSCVESADITITTLPPPVPNSGNFSFCNGGSQILDAGTGFSTYSWSTGESSQTITVVAPGTYDVTVTDNNSCSGTGSFVVTQNPPINVAISGDLVICDGGSTTLTADAGYDTYSWSTGAASASITVNSTGVYSVTVTDAQSCTGTASVTVTDMVLPAIDITQQPDFLCAGSSVSLDAGFGFASYSWSTGENSQIINIQLPGNYSVTVENNAGCMQTGDINVALGATPTPFIDGTLDICQGTTTTLTVLGGNFDTVLWSTGEQTQSISVSATGIYAVTVTNADGCSAETQELVTVSPGPEPQITGVTYLCPGDNGVLATIDSYDSYAWSTGESSAQIQVFNAGFYSVTATDANGCTGVDTYEVQTATAPIPIIDGDLTFCENESTTLSLTENFDSYLWSDGSSQPFLIVNAPGDYSVTVTNQQGCSGETTVTAIENPLPIPIIDGPAFMCFGQENVEIGVLDPYDTYIWNTGASTQNIFVNAPGTYYVTVTDAFGCTGSNQFTLVQLDPVEPEIIGDLLICDGDFTTLSIIGDYDQILWSDGSTGSSIDVYNSGPVSVFVMDANGCTGETEVTVTKLPAINPEITGDLIICDGDFTVLSIEGDYNQILWTNGSTGTSIDVYDGGPVGVFVLDDNGCSGTTEVTVIKLPAVDPEITGDLFICNDDFTVLTVGSFDQILWSDGTSGNSIDVYNSGQIGVTVTDQNGCSGTAEVSATELEAVEPQITGDLFFCNGGFTSLNVGNYDQILWSDGSTGSSIDVITPGPVSVTVVDDLGCQGQTEEIITQLPIPSVEIVGPELFCEGSMVILETSEPFATYQWSTGDDTATTPIDQTGEYWVTVTDANGCEAIDDIFVQTLAPPAFEVVGSRTFCPGSETTLSVLEDFVSYEWSNGSTLASITVNTAGPYIVTVTDNLGCMSSVSVMVSEQANLNPTISGGPSFCAGDTITLSAGDGYDEYLWSTGATESTIHIDEPGIYSVTVSENTGCSGEASKEIIRYDNPSPIITGVDTVCVGTEANLGLEQTYQSYQWSTEALTPSIIAQGGLSYSVTVTDENGCKGSAMHDVGLWQNPVPNILGDTVFCPEAQTTLSLENDYPSITWSTGSTADMITVNTENTFTVEVVDEHGCEGTDIQSTAYWNTVIPEISGSFVYCPDESTEIAVFQPFASYQWSNGDTTSFTSIQTEGNIFVTVTDGHNCQTSSSEEITELNVEELNFVGPTAFCEGDTITLGLADQFSSYLWSNGDTSQEIRVWDGGIYDVTVGFDNSCSAASSINIVENALPNVHIGGSASYCVGSSTILNAGDTYQTYVWSTGATDYSIEVATEATYTLTVTDENGCVNNASLDVIQDDFLHPIISGDLAFCEESSTTLNAGDGFATYTWSNNETGQLIEVDSPGVYQITVTDAGGCIGETSVEVIQNPLPHPEISGTLAYCEGESTTLQVLDADLYSSFEWSTNSDLPSIEVSEPGDYHVNVTNEFNCKNGVTTNVVEHAAPVFTIEGIDFFCEGNATALSGPEGMSQYLWSTGSQEREITALDEGHYELEVTNEFNCKASNGIDVQEIGLPNVPIGGDKYLDCDTDNVSLGQEVTNVNPDWVFHWNGPSIDNNSTQVNPIAYSPGVYSLVIEDTLHACLSIGQSMEVFDLSYHPEIQILVLDSLDCLTQSVRLNTYSEYPLGEEFTYQWSKDQSIIDGAVQDFYLATEPGFYAISIVDTLTACQGEDGKMVIENIAFPIADAGEDNLLDCNVTDVTIGSENSQIGPNITYEWTTLLGQQDLMNNHELSVNVSLPGTYQLTVRDTLNGCENMDTTIVLQNILKPTVNAGSDQTIDCHTDEVLLDGSASSAGANYLYQWLNMEDTSLVSTEPAVQVNTAGTYQLVVTNNDNGCSESDNVLVDLDDNFPRGLVVEESKVVCFGDNNGALSVQSVIGDEEGPFIYNLNGQAFTSSPVFAQLEAGNYILTVQNPEGCEYSESFVIEEGNDLTLDLGDDQFILLGDSTQVAADISIDLDKVTTMIWTVPDSINCVDTDCVTIDVKPFQTTDYKLTIIDENGCKRADEVTIYVEKPRDVFIPSAFSPNGDNINDILMVFSGTDVSYVRSFLIFNRWGENVFEVYNFPTNEPTYGWDGKHKGRMMNTGVFVYQAEVVFIDGETKIFKGDITLMK